MVGPAAREITWVRLCVLLVFMSTLAPLVHIVWRAAGFSVGGSAALSTGVFVLALPGLIRVTPIRLADGAAGQRWLFACWMALSLFAGYRLARLGVFMLDAERTEYAITPKIRPSTDPEMEKPFYVRHNCFTAYVVAGQLAGQGVENVYQPGQYRDSVEPTPIHETIGDTFTIDRYQYPPTFLILPRLLLATGHDFFRLRTYWFALNVLVFCGALGALILWVSGRQFSVYWLAWPAVLLAPITLGTLQIGNVHFLIISLSVLAMVAFENGRDRLGGALLGFAVASKIFPGVLLAYLLVRKRYRAVVWTCVAMVVFGLVTLLALGRQPFEAFFTYQLPRLASGEAFAFAREHIRAIAVNLSVMGVAFKLARIGWLTDMNPHILGSVITWCYTALLAAAIVIAGIRHRDQKCIVAEPCDSSGACRFDLARIWLVLLILGQIRSPFLPWGYGNVAVLWLLALMAAGRSRGWVRMTVLVPLWAILAVTIPLPWGPQTVALDLTYTLAALFVILALCLFIVAKRPAPPATA